MRDRIVEKLDTFLKKHSMTEECEVVYLLVELRKILDKDREMGSDKYSLVRFHADWAVHTKKDRVTPAMREIMTKIEESIDVYPKNGDIRFLLLPEFRNELLQLLKGNNLPHDFCQNDEKWFKFIFALTQVVADQPIINPSDNIAEFRYVDMKKEGIMVTIDFKNRRDGASITLGFGR